MNQVDYFSTQHVQDDMEEDILSLSDKESVDWLVSDSIEEMEQDSTEMIKIEELNEKDEIVDLDSLQTRLNTIKKLESLALDVIEQIHNINTGDIRPISLPFLKRGSTTTGDHLALKNRTIRFPKKVQSSRSGSGAKELAMLLRIVEIIHDAISRDVTVTKRDIYYRDVNLFKTQIQVDRLVDDLSATLEISRADLHTFASSKGLLSGNIQLKTSDDQIISASKLPALIPPTEVISEIMLEESVQFVLVVEKEAVFTSLLSVDFPNDHRFGKSVLITGKGYPDLATRQLLYRLSIEERSKHIPMYILVDCDPHGIDILSVYKFGSHKMSFQTGLSVEKIEWIGLRCSEWKRHARDFMLNLDSHLLLPLTKSDLSKAEQLRSRKGLPQSWCDELSLMLEMGFKAEIQALLSHKPNHDDYRRFQIDDGLVEYLLTKLKIGLTSEE
ncbi:Spo11/DNA topoisomerase VI subunit A [Melampsora americana]|nr:Spo11/DNA topoisomerase VI subunit A [Melampsora americana]